jgi:UPF0716 protein FxsA
LLLTPGFITDAVGLLLLIPPTRAAFRRLLSRSIMSPSRLGWTRVVIRDPRGPRPQPTARPDRPAPPPALPPSDKPPQS